MRTLKELSLTALVIFVKPCSVVFGSSLVSIKFGGGSKADIENGTVSLVHLQSANGCVSLIDVISYAVTRHQSEHTSSDVRRRESKDVVHEVDVY